MIENSFGVAFLAGVCLFFVIAWIASCLCPIPCPPTQQNRFHDARLASATRSTTPRGSQAYFSLTNSSETGRP